MFGHDDFVKGVHVQDSKEKNLKDKDFFFGLVHGKKNIKVYDASINFNMALF